MADTRPDGLLTALASEGGMGGRTRGEGCRIHTRSILPVRRPVVARCMPSSRVYLAPSVAFPLDPAARALGVPAVLVRTALHQLSEAGLVRIGPEDDHEDGPRVRVTLLPPFPQGNRQERALKAATPRGDHRRPHPHLNPTAAPEDRVSP